MIDPLIQQYRKWQKRPFGLKDSYQFRTVAEANDQPLVFAPGESWDYSTGVDWAGVMVERVNGNITLEEYLKKNVWGPLGMNLATFHPYKNPEVKSRYVDFCIHRFPSSYYQRNMYADKIILGWLIWHYEKADSICSGQALTQKAKSSPQTRASSTPKPSTATVAPVPSGKSPSQSRFPSSPSPTHQPILSPTN